MENNGTDLRTIFIKKGRASFISHLDLVRTMSRALKRAKIPFWYTQGFNPHPYIMFPLALSLGAKSECEIMDFRIMTDMNFDEIMNKLNAQLPIDLQIKNVFYPVQKHTEIAKAEYKIHLKTSLSSEEMHKKWKEFIAQEKIEVVKKTKKKGETLIDIKPSIECLDVETKSDDFFAILRLPAGTVFNLNVSLVTDSFSDFISEKFEVYNILRTKILNKDNEIFS